MERLGFDELCKPEGDLYGQGIECSASEAVEIWLHGEYIKQEPFNQTKGYIVFYHFEACIEFILQHSLKILSVTGSLGAVNILTEQTEYKLRKIAPNDYEKVYHFVLLYDNEFVPKLSWRGRKLAEMCLDGLNSGKWAGYAYFDNEDKIISYLDYKIRIDTDIELGVALTHEDYRKKGLVSSLKWFFMLIFPTLGFYAGTYEENEPMKNTFAKTGFEPREFWNEEMNVKTNKIRERIVLQDSESIENNQYKLTNSVYYYSQSILKESPKRTNEVI